MSLFSIDIASDLLKYIAERDNVSVCHLTDLYAKSRAIDGQRWQKYYQPMNGFVDTVCHFMQNRPKSLISFGVLHRYQSFCSYDNLKDDYFGAYQTYLQFLLSQIRNEISRNNGDIFDGYLKLQLPEANTFLKRTNDYKYRNEWSKQNIECSLKISRLICEIQTELKHHNLENPQNEKKIILDLYKLQLYQEHIDFLEFWFNNDEML